MATIVAHQDFDSRGLDLYGIAVTDPVQAFLSNANTTSPEATIYEDALRLAYTIEGWDYFTYFAGSSFTIDIVSGDIVVTGGTLSGIFQTVQSGPHTGADFSIEGLNLNAVDVYNAFTTSSTADDLALIRTGLAGKDTITLLAASADYAQGFAGNDTMNGGGGSDTLDGGGGNDSLVGGAGLDRLVGGRGNDRFVVTVGDTVVETTNGGIADIIVSTGSWSLAASPNVERLQLAGTKAIDGTGNILANVITGNGASNILNGGASYDTLNGGGGNDQLIGGTGNDSLSGQDGDDTLAGGLGYDTLIGGAGADRFVFNTALGAGNLVRFGDELTYGSDRIVLDDDVFTAFAGRQVVAADVGTFLHYSLSTAGLYYDDDGAGPGAAILFAFTTQQALSTPAIVALMLVVD